MSVSYSEFPPVKPLAVLDPSIFNANFWRCVVCTKSVSPLSSTAKEEDGELRNGVFEEPFALRRALAKIFKYLAMKPEDEGTSIEALSEEWKNKPFCSKCFDIVDSVAKLHVKILELELLIQEKVETLGNVVRCSVSPVKSKRTSRTVENSLESGDVTFQPPEVDPWTRIRKSVACKYEDEMFPSPRVTLEDLVKKSSKGGGLSSNEKETCGKDSQETLVIGMLDDGDHFDDIQEHFEIQGPEFSDANQHGMVLLAEIEIPMPTAGKPELVDASSVIGCRPNDPGISKCSSEDYEKNVTGTSIGTGETQEFMKTFGPLKLPTVCSCPKEGCDFSEPVVLSKKTKYTGIVREKQSVLFARKKLICHYMNQHLEVNMSDVNHSEKEGFYYACNLCDFRSLVKNPGHGHKITYQPRLHLASHYISIHEGGWKADERIPRTRKLKNGLYGPKPPKVNKRLPRLPNGEKRKRKNKSRAKFPKVEVQVTFSAEKLYDTTNFGCPLCPFKPEFDESWKGPTRTILRMKASNQLYSHYNTFHLPVRPEHIQVDQQTGMKFYKCTVCDFKQIVKLSSDNSDNTKGYSRTRLIRHYLQVHHEGTEDDEQTTIKKPKPKEKQTGPIVTVPCPESDCTHTVNYINAGTPFQKAKVKRVALLNLCKHCIAVHDFPDKTVICRRFRNKCIEVIDGQEVFKCFRCDLILKVDFPENCGDETKKHIQVARLATYDKFLTHYIPHVVPKSEGKNAVVTYKSLGFVDDKSSPRASIRCQHCPFVMRKKSSWQTHGDRTLLTTLMKNNIHRHYRLEHPEVTVPKFRYYKLRKNLVQYNQEDVAVNDKDEDSDDVDSEEDREYPSDIELKPESVDSESESTQDTLVSETEDDDDTKMVVGTDEEELSDEAVEEKYDPDYYLEVDEDCDTQRNACDSSDSE